MTRPMLLLSLIAIAIEQAASVRTVLVTGATGGTGQLIYAGFKENSGFEVRGLVSSVAKAKTVLHCTKCDESEVCIT